MSGAWTFPGEFNCSTPASEVHSGAGVVVQVVEHGAVVVTRILVYGGQHLRRVSEAKHRTDVHSLVDVLSRFCSAVVDHGTILSQDVTKMYTGGDVGLLVSILSKDAFLLAQSSHMISFLNISANERQALEKIENL